MRGFFVYVLLLLCVFVYALRIRFLGFLEGVREYVVYVFTRAYLRLRRRFSFFIRLRCHFHRIWPFFFQRRELLFIVLANSGRFIRLWLFTARFL